MSKYLKSSTRMKFGLIGALGSVLFGKSNDVDVERNRAGGEHIDHAVVAQSNLEFHLLEEATEATRGSIRVTLRLCARARALARRPHGRRCLRFAQLHANHVVLLLVLDVHALLGDLAQVQVTSGRERADDVRDCGSQVVGGRRQLNPNASLLIAFRRQRRQFTRRRCHLDLSSLFLFFFFFSKFKFHLSILIYTKRIFKLFFFYLLYSNCSLLIYFFIRICFYSFFFYLNNI